MIENDIIRRIKTISINSEHKFSFIAQYVINNAKEVSQLTIKQLATQTFSSPATIHRFVHYVGLDGYKEFVYVLRYYNRNHLKNNELKNTDNNIQGLEKHFENLINDLSKTKDIILSQNQALIDISKKIEKASRIYLFSIGGTSHIVNDFYNKLLRIGLSVTLSTNYYEGFNVVENITLNDLVIFISYSGETKELIEFAKVCQVKNLDTIGITKQVNNTLGALVKTKLEVISGEPIFRLYSMTSRAVLLLTLDAIYLSLLNLNNKKYLDLLSKTMIEKI